MAASRGDHLRLPVGEVVRNRYEVIEEVGCGNFSKVYRCYDNTKTSAKERRRAPVAMKVLKKEYKNDAAFEKRMLRILQENDSTKDARVSKMIEYFEWQDCPVFIMPIHGPSVRARRLGIDRGCVTRPLLVKFAYDILETIRFIHIECSMVHTDLKPENILISDTAHAHGKSFGDSWVICDFGSASVCRMDKLDSDLISTRPYRAPEVVLGNKWYYAADMWSVGCILYEVAVGHRLFEVRDDNTHLQMMEKRLGKLPEVFRRHSKYSPRFFSSRGDFLIVSDTIRNLRIRLTPLTEVFSNDPDFLRLLQGLLTLEPSKRWSAEEALEDSIFDGLRERAHRPAADGPLDASNESEEEAENEEAAAAEPPGSGAGDHPSAAHSENGSQADGAEDEDDQPPRKPDEQEDNGTAIVPPLSLAQTTGRLDKTQSSCSSSQPHGKGDNADLNSSRGTSNNLSGRAARSPNKSTSSTGQRSLTATSSKKPATKRSGTSGAPASRRTLNSSYYRTAKPGATGAPGGAGLASSGHGRPAVRSLSVHDSSNANNHLVHPHGYHSRTSSAHSTSSLTGTTKTPRAHNTSTDASGGLSARAKSTTSSLSKASSKNSPTKMSKRPVKAPVSSAGHGSRPSSRPGSARGVARATGAVKRTASGGARDTASGTTGEKTFRRQPTTPRGKASQASGAKTPRTSSASSSGTRGAAKTGGSGPRTPRKSSGASATAHAVEPFSRNSGEFSTSSLAALQKNLRVEMSNADGYKSPGARTPRSLTPTRTANQRGLLNMPASPDSDAKAIAASKQSAYRAVAPGRRDAATDGERNDSDQSPRSTTTPITKLNPEGAEFKAEAHGTTGNGTARVSTPGMVNHTVQKRRPVSQPRLSAAPAAPAEPSTAAPAASATAEVLPAAVAVPADEVPAEDTPAAPPAAKTTMTVTTTSNNTVANTRVAPSRMALHIPVSTSTKVERRTPTAVPASQRPSQSEVQGKPTEAAETSKESSTAQPASVGTVVQPGAGSTKIIVPVLQLDAAKASVLGSSSDGASGLQSVAPLQSSSPTHTDDTNSTPPHVGDSSRPGSLTYSAASPRPDDYTSPERVRQLDSQSFSARGSPSSISQGGSPRVMSPSTADASAAAEATHSTKRTSAAAASAEFTAKASTISPVSAGQRTSQVPLAPPPQLVQKTPAPAAGLMQPLPPAQAQPPQQRSTSPDPLEETQQSKQVAPPQNARESTSSNSTGSTRKRKAAGTTKSATARATKPVSPAPPSEKALELHIDAALLSSAQVHENAYASARAGKLPAQKTIMRSPVNATRDDSSLPNPTFYKEAKDGKEQLSKTVVPEPVAGRRVKQPWGPRMIVATTSELQPLAPVAKTSGAGGDLRRSSQSKRSSGSLQSSITGAGVNGEAAAASVGVPDDAVTHSQEYPAVSTIKNSVKLDHTRHQTHAHETAGSPEAAAATGTAAEAEKPLRERSGSHSFKEPPPLPAVRAAVDASKAYASRREKYMQHDPRQPAGQPRASISIEHAERPHSAAEPSHAGRPSQAAAVPPEPKGTAATVPTATAPQVTAPAIRTRSTGASTTSRRRVLTTGNNTAAAATTSLATAGAAAAGSGETTPSPQPSVPSQRPSQDPASAKHTGLTSPPPNSATSERDGGSGTASPLLDYAALSKEYSSLKNPRKAAMTSGGAQKSQGVSPLSKSQTGVDSADASATPPAAECTDSAATADGGAGRPSTAGEAVRNYRRDSYTLRRVRSEPAGSPKPNGVHADSVVSGASNGSAGVSPLAPPNVEEAAQHS